MNATEKKYVMDRISCLHSTKHKAILEACKDKPRLTTAQEIELIRNGKVKLVLPQEIRWNTNLTDCYNFNEFQPDNTNIEKEREKRLAALHKETQRLKDTLMLGDCTEALAMLEAFSEKEF